MDSQRTLSLRHAARLLGVPLELARSNLMVAPDGSVSLVEVDMLLARPTAWVHEGRTELVLREVSAVHDAAQAAISTKTDQVLAEIAAQQLTTEEVATMLSIPVAAVEALAPRRGWDAGSVADVLRRQPAWLASPRAAMDEARAANRKAAAREHRQRAAASEKVRRSDRNRSRWAETYAIPIHEVPESFTKECTPPARARFEKRPPKWAAPYLGAFDD